MDSVFDKQINAIQFFKLIKKACNNLVLFNSTIAI